MSLKDVPLRAIRKWVMAIRSRYFTIDVSEGPPTIVCKIDHEKFERRLRAEKHFESGAGPSYVYEYEGKREDANLRRPAGLDGEDRQMQLHPRLFDMGDGRTRVLVHWEPSWHEHPEAHIHERGFTWDGGVDRFTTLLDELYIEYHVEE